MPDITETLKADSTQLNAIDFAGNSHIYTVASVRVVSGDQPVNIRLVEDDREYRPSKSMRRVLAACWGPDSDAWVGQRFEVYNDPAVKWGGKEVGGIKVKAVTGIDKPKKVMLQESSTVRKPHVVEPLADAPTPKPPEPTVEQVAACTDLGVLQRMFDASGPERQAQITSHMAELSTPATLPQSGADVDPNAVRGVES